jgi:hypothetical protein
MSELEIAISFLTKMRFKKVWVELGNFLFTTVPFPRINEVPVPKGVSWLIFNLRMEKKGLLFALLITLIT